MLNCCFGSKRKVAFSTCLATSLLFLGAGACAQAASFDLSTDFSLSSNPNGAWSFVYSGSPLANVGAPSADQNSLIPAIGAGYYSTGNDLNADTPDVIKTVVNGSASSGISGSYNDNDFLAGDIIVHSPNDGTAVEIIWTAPSNGVVSFSSSIWYAHIVSGATVDRINTDTVSLGSTTYGSQAISPVSFGSRGSAWSLSETGLAVVTGEQLIVELQKATGQDYGSLNGVALSGTFTSSVPEPSTWAMLLIGFTGLAFSGRRAARANRATA